MSRRRRIERSREVLAEGRGWRVERTEARHGPLRERFESVAAESGCEPEGWRRLFEALDRIADAPRPAQAVEAFLQDVLATYGLPPWRYGEAWRIEPDGTFARDDLSVRRPECEYVAHPAAVIRNEAHPARAALEVLRTLHRAVQQSDPDAAVRAGWQAGQLAALLEREAEIAAGEGAKEGAHEGGTARAREQRAQYEARLAELEPIARRMRENNPKLSRNSLAQLIAARHRSRFGSERTVRRMLKELGL